jgi:hypothetical protein
MISAFFLPTIGGIEAHIYNISKALIKKGHKVIVINPLLEDNKQKIVKEILDGITIYRIYLGKDKTKKMTEKFPEGKMLFLSGFMRKVQYNLYSDKIYVIIEDIIQKNNIDIIHQHDFISSMRLSKKLSKKYPVILTNHTGEFLILRRKKYMMPILENIINHFSAIIGPSKELCDIPFKNMKSKVYYIPNGVNVELFRELNKTERERLRKKYKFSNNEIIILCPRRWAPTKGVKYFALSIKKIEEICKEYVIRYIFAGNDYKGYLGYSNEVSNILKESGVMGKITLLGDIPHDRISEYYNLSDIIVLPSLMEATSLSALEAMACAKALVATNVGGLPEIIENNFNGILVKPEDPQMLAQAISKLIKDQSLRYILGQNGRDIAINSFSWDVIAEKTLEIYKKVRIKNRN